MPDNRLYVKLRLFEWDKRLNKKGITNEKIFKFFNDDHVYNCNGRMCE